jgi:hypothetical protein
MPLGKDDAPDKPKDDTKTLDAGDHSATNKAIDAGAGAPAALRDAAEALPEGDPVKDATKAAMLADDAQTEAKQKAKVVDASPNADETPSGIALKAVTGISDDVKRGEEYARIKSAVRHGYVPATADDLKAKK